MFLADDQEPLGTNAEAMGWNRAGREKATILQNSSIMGNSWTHLRNGLG
jgi:hypothetical protein